MHCPNGLPVKCIRHDNLMLECEHGDHPDYIMPVVAEYTDKEEAKQYDHDTFLYEDSERDLALIYANTCIAVTMYECCYQFWHLASREVEGKMTLFEPGEKGRWLLSEESVAKIIEYLRTLERFKNNEWTPSAWRNK